MVQLHLVAGCGQDRLRHAGLDRVLIEKARPPVKFVDGAVGGTGRTSADKDRPSAPAWAVQLPTLGMRSTRPDASGPIHGRCWCEHQQTNRPAQDETSMALSAHGTVRGRRLGLAGRRWTAVGNPPSLERRCHMARLRRMLLTLAVAALLLVGTASTALAGITATAID